MSSCHNSEVFIDYSHIGYNEMSFNCDSLGKVFTPNNFTEVEPDDRKQMIKVVPLVWNNELCFGVVDAVIAYKNSAVIYPYYLGVDREIAPLFVANSDEYPSLFEQIHTEMNIQDEKTKEFILMRIQAGIIELSASRSWSHNIGNYPLLVEYYIPNW